MKRFRKVFLIIFFAVLIFFIFSFIKSREYYVAFEDPKVEQLVQNLRDVFPELKNTEITASNKSFTINKKDIYLCTKDERGQYYHDNMLVYVLLHELAHTLCDDIGHTEKYKEIFKGLLHRAQQHKLYDPNIPPVNNYCEY